MQSLNPNKHPFQRNKDKGETILFLLAKTFGNTRKEEMIVSDALF